MNPAHLSHVVAENAHGASGCPFMSPDRIFTDLAAARVSGELPWSEVFEGKVVTRYEDIVRILHDPDTFSSSITVGQAPEPWLSRIKDHVPLRGTLLGLDNPDHDRLRSAVNTFFVPRRLTRFAPWIEEQANLLIDGFVEAGQTEIKTAFGLPLALRVISKIVGLDPERAEWYGRALSFFQGPRDLYHPGTPDEKVEDLLELHRLINDVMAERRDDRRDDLISHVWNERDAGLQMTDFEMLSLFPGLMLAGHETSSNLICMALSHLLADRALWERAQRDDQSRARALEELIRYESAITGMNRLVTEDVVLGEHTLVAGDRLFVAYAAGSRDPDHFPDPDVIDFDRPVENPHFGFGQGIHACLGAPLARLLLNIELKVLHERLPDIATTEPYEQRRYTAVSEGRGMVGLPLRWTPQPARLLTVDVTEPVTGTTFTVRGISLVAEEVVELILYSGSHAAAPDPGAHVDVTFPNGITRQYSVIESDKDSIRIAVLHEQQGRGASRYVHERLRVGDSVQVGAARNHFKLRPGSRFNLFVAGGIGITPLIPMIKASEITGTPWRLLYLGSDVRRMAYADELKSDYPTNVYLWDSATRGRFDIDTIWERMPADAAVYACGPERLLTALEASAIERGRLDDLVLERFAPRDEEHAPNTPFEVELASTGEVLQVPEDRSVLDVINEAGAGILSTCREGTCGTCEVRVLAGIPEHRDSVLDRRERLANETMMTCVSRCQGKRLVLDV